jgi:succinoglycan biosynthesis protein ExoA
MQQLAGQARGDDCVLVVIPCLNEARHIGGLLDHLLTDPALERARVVVADGGSEDGTREIVAGYGLRDARVQLLHNPKRLQSAGVNLAVARFGAEVEWVVRVDAHADYPGAYVSTLLEEARRREASSVVVAMDTRGLTCFQRAAAAAQNSLLGAGGSAHRQGGAAGWVDHGHHALFRRQDFVRAGGYDETFSHNEDAELDLRLGAQGARIWLTDRATLVYYPRETPGALWRQYLNYGRGRARTVLKHRVRLKLRQAAPLAVAPAVLLAVAAPLNPLLGAPAAAWMLACLTFGLALGLKARCGCAAGAGFAAMIMHLAWSLGFWRQLAISGRPISGKAAPAATA